MSSTMVYAHPRPCNNSSALRTIYQFPPRHWIENIAVRKTGELVATDIAQSQVYLVDPNKPGIEPPVVAKFPTNTSLTGITEVSRDEFYIQSVQGDVYSFKFQPNSSAVYRVSLQDYHRTGIAEVGPPINITTAIVLNGMTTLNAEKGIVLLSDSVGGVIYSLNVRTEQYEIVLDDALLKPDFTMNPPFGVNGIRIVGKYLYFANTNFGRTARVPVDLGTGRPTREIEVISENVPAADDFAVDEKTGTVYVAQNVANSVSSVHPDGTAKLLTGGVNSTQLLGPVSAQFGRGKWDRKTLYISTDGLGTDLVTGERLAAGKIAALDLSTY
ncbi:Hypothetical protein D9617_21g097730 [Elsinoe fawcettii]|nr:Hypothetical protein D9617_21g097730 [Elsinoe fawcettii]